MKLLKETTTILKELHQVEVDAFYAYKQAIDHIENRHIASELKKFRQEHEEHIETLEDLLMINNEKVPIPSKDVKGFILEGMTMVRSLMGDKQALLAMKQNEELTNQAYKKALEKIATSDPRIMDILIKNYQDEQEHMHFIIAELEHFDEKMEHIERADSQKGETTHLH